MKLYDVYGLKKAAALYATQPRGRSSSPVDIVTEHGTGAPRLALFLLDGVR